jgi:hypothetical protein
VKHADYKQITATSPKSTNPVTLDYQILIFGQNLNALIINMFHSVPLRSAEKMERFAGLCMVCKSRRQLCGILQNTNIAGCW